MQICCLRSHSPIPTPHPKKNPAQRDLLLTWYNFSGRHRATLRLHNPLCTRIGWDLSPVFNPSKLLCFLHAFFFFFFRHTKQIVYATGVAGLSWAPVQPCPAKEVQLALGLGTVPCQTFWTLVVLGWQPNLLQRVCWNQRKKECHKVLHVLSCPSLDTPSHCLKCSQTLGANVITTWHNQSNMTNNGGPPVLQDGAESGSVSSGPRHRCSCPWVKPPLITKSYPHCNNKPSFSDIKLFLYKIWQSVNIYSIYSCRYNGPRTEASNFLSLWLRGWDALVQFTRCTTTTIVVRYHNTGGK